MNKKPTLKEVYKTLPRLPQRQDDLQTQVLDAGAILNKLGMYDVLDLLKGIHHAPLLLSLLDAAVATLQNNLHLCDGENCTIYALLKAVEAIDPNWEAQ